jgi:NAD-dependent SIR2 family protein deacetylase
MPNVEPNPAHLALSKLEKHFDVTNITQNVSDLLERGGSTNVIHLHGELTKARGCYNNSSDRLDIEHKVYDIGYNDIENGDKCEKTGSQLRPHIVWFNEMPFRTDEAYNAVHEADILIIVGTSLQISYTLDLLTNVRRIVSDSKNPCKIYYVDPSPMHYLDNYGLSIEYIVESASKGITELVESLISKETEKEVG